MEGSPEESAVIMRSHDIYVEIRFIYRQRISSGLVAVPGRRSVIDDGGGTSAATATNNNRWPNNNEYNPVVHGDRTAVELMLEPVPDPLIIIISFFNSPPPLFPFRQLLLAEKT